MTDSSSTTDPKNGQSGGEVAERPQQRPPARRHVAVPLGEVIRDYDQAMALAVALGPSNVVPKALRHRPADIFLNLMYSAELDLTPVQGFRAINIIDGTPTLSVDYLIVRVRQAGHKFEITEWTSEKCTTKVTRGDNGQSQEFTFTLEDAVIGGMCSIDEKTGRPRARSRDGGKPLPWEQSPRKMLMWRAASNNIDSICPEVSFGFAVNDGTDLAPDDTPVPPAPPQDLPTSLAEAVEEREARAAEQAAAQNAAAEAEVTDAEVVEEETPADDGSGPPTVQELADLAREHALGPDLDPPHLTGWFCPTCEGQLDASGGGHEPGCSRAQDGAHPDDPKDDDPEDLYVPTEEEMAAEERDAAARQAGEVEWPPVAPIPTGDPGSFDGPKSTRGKRGQR